jgi:putative ABC transport system permease protein
MMARNPGYFAFVVGTMALGIACLTAVFSVANGVLLEPLPYPRSQDLVSIQSVHSELGNNLLSRIETFEAFHSGTESLDLLAAVQTADLQLMTDTGGRSSRVLLSSPGLFEMLGASPALGRLFLEGEGRAGDQRVAVLSHRLWREAFAEHREILGRVLRFAGDAELGVVSGEEGAFTVVGVLPAGFRAPFPNYDPDLWIADSFDVHRSSATTHVLAFGRLAEPSDLATAQTELASIFDRLQRATSSDEPQWRTRLVPLRVFLSGSLRRPLELLFLGGILVLGVAVANTTNLLIARAGMRASEAAVRGALGADRGRLVRQLAIENAIPAALAGSAGLAGAWLLVKIIRNLGADVLPQRFDVGIDGTAITLAVLATLAADLLFAVVPRARWSGARLAGAMQWRKASGTRRSRRLHFGLAGLQVGLALVLTLTALLLVESLQRLRRIDPGFEARDVLTAGLSLAEAYYPEGRHRRSFYERLLREVRSLPEVSYAGLVNYLPFSGNSAATEVSLENPAAELAGQPVRMSFATVSPGYLETMRISLLAGRTFEDWDSLHPAAVVSRDAARWLWGGRNPIGQRVKLGGPRSRNSWAEVVGVVDDVRQDSLTQESQPMIYLPLLTATQMTLVARSSTGRPEQLVAAIRECVAKVDPQQPLVDVETLVARVDRSLGRARLSALLMSVLGIVSLLLAAVGIYGATWQTVVERWSEIGVRYALGADERSILSLVLGGILPWLIAGLALGTLGALGLGRYLSSILFEVEMTDPAVLLGACSVVAAVALVGTWAPTRKAAKVDPAAIIKA